MILAEWHLTPEYLLENWTDEQFARFWDARNERMKFINQSAQRPADYEDQRDKVRVSDTQLFAMMGIKQAQA